MAATEKAYQVTLELFEGPLDLLLFLVKKDDLDIHNIPIAHITKEYLAYLDLLKEFNLDVAGEFLVMAATLMAYKSDRKSTRLNSSHQIISYAVFCLKKKNNI